MTKRIKRDIVRVTCWEDMLNREDHVTDVDPKTTKPIHILARYDLKRPFRPGGFVGRHLHGEGVLVILDTEKTTHIGLDCAAQHFGKEFIDRLKKGYDTAAHARDLKERFAKHVKNLHRYKKEAKDLLDSVHESVQRIRVFLEKDVSRAVDRRIRQRAQRHDGIVRVSRARSAAEIDDAFAAAGPGADRRNLRYEDIELGEIIGLQAVAEFERAKDQVLKRIRQPIFNLEEAKESKTTMIEKVVRDLDELPNEVKKMQGFCTAVATFLSPQNRSMIDTMAKVEQLAL